MLSHHDLAVLCGRSYQGPQSGLVAGDVRWDALVRDEEIIIVVPGTHPTDALNWVRDFRAFPMWIPGIGICHSGFVTGGFALWQKLKVLGDVPADRQVTYTGHSLGGAIAQVLAALHAMEGHRLPCRVVTFGAPRVPLRLNFEFGRLVRKASEAVEYHRPGDPVPDLPRILYGHPTWGRQIGTRLPGWDPVLNHAISLYAKDLEPSA